MNICEKCGEYCLDCRCSTIKIEWGGTMRCITSEGVRNMADVLNDIEQKKQNECHKAGCRNLETRCKDCGRVVNSTEIPSEWGNSGWISVKDRLPELEYQLCIVYNTSGYMDFQRAIWHKRLNSFVLYNPNEHEKLLLHVTHWMPLPELPKE